MNRSYHVKNRSKLPDGGVMAFRNRSSSYGDSRPKNFFPERLSNLETVWHRAVVLTHESWITGSINRKLVRSTKFQTPFQTY